MMIAIEEAVCARLQDGLGIAAAKVVSWDVMTDDIGRILGRLPGAFVTFTGITGSQPHDTRRTRYKVSACFAVFVADYNARENEAVRHGDARTDEPGCYRLIRAVRRLLSGQDLGLSIGRLVPLTVKMVTGKSLGEKAIGLYECLFSTFWYEDVLENNRWPVAPGQETHPDHDFVLWEGRLDDAVPEHRETHAAWRLQGQSGAEDAVKTSATPESRTRPDDDGPLL